MENGVSSPKNLASSEKLARLRLIRTETVGPTTFRALIARYGSANDALNAIPELAVRGGRRKPLTIPSKRAAEAELAQINRFGAFPLFLGDAGYPRRLAAIEDAPPVLIAKGTPHLLNHPAIAIVGARNASTTGRKQAHKMARELTDAGIVIVSGLARGIDTAAHSGALINGTIAVVGGGLDVYYPKENESLQKAIAEQGLLLSDEPLGLQPQARHFPKRNRIIAGLSLGVLVVEAAQKSGSLITARLAGEQGREIFAIPGSPLDPRCKGTNALIKDGAILVENSSDIITYLNNMHSPASEPDMHLYETESIETDHETSEAERNKIREMLSPTPTLIDEIARDCALSTSTVLSVLLELELAGHVERQPGGKVALIGDLY